MDPKEQIEQGLRAVFEASLPERVGRKGRVKSHPIIPGHYFASASMECRDHFVAGSFYGCISLVQAVAEAVSRFVAKVNANPSVGDPVERVRILQKRGFLSEPIKNAFESIWRDRNEFHHMNPNVEIDKNRLEGRAEDCLKAWASIESDLFGFQTRKGKVVPMNPKFWPGTASGQTAVYVDFE